MGVEIERKFLVDHKKWEQVTKPEGNHFRQGYLLDEDNRTIRIRVTDKEGFITIKGATKGISRLEFEYSIPTDEGNALLDNFALSELDKTRYCLDFEGKLWEVDEFAGENSGLIMAEIELESEDEEFTLPHWITHEVSDDARYYNSNLSRNPFNGWAK
ncbi:CYTH domain-containing protein [Mucilaginibacter sp.]|uniref:CYTH domain-containing protein n=1 Tax=Mucilaginibacter sp. TaxID=1882438 RepID=UPI003D0FBD1C